MNEQRIARQLVRLAREVAGAEDWELELQEARDEVFRFLDKAIAALQDAYYDDGVERHVWPEKMEEVKRYVKAAVAEAEDSNDKSLAKQIKKMQSSVDDLAKRARTVSRQYNKAVGDLGNLTSELDRSVGRMKSDIRNFRRM